MALKYSIEPMGPRPGKYYIRTYPRAIIRRDELIQRIVNSTGLNAVDAAAFLDAFEAQWIEALVQGDFISLDDMFGITLSVEPDMAITDPNYTIDPATVTVRVNGQIKNRIQQMVRSGYQTATAFDKITPFVRLPQINQVYDWTTQQAGKYSPGGMLEITGGGLDLPSDMASDPLNGVFFKAAAIETRATIYPSEGDTKIQCIVPASVTATTIEVIVRSDYGGPTLREGKITGIAKA